ncbi:CDP-4-dehydro-6-deoxy-D-gulose 4-reductase [Halomicroarcula limicola]|uniref:CDP-4-dehydro-6-deoxy-D-gulose 4-reductase n=1 Tax=Haloarcula limicola TaxID=1429915 RepID=A0A8J7Y8W7_9EURY|nr:cellulose synthase operon protein YhjQ/BcsQ [Halomicroarcula limicola]MBV0923404.1 CDP-4-dehydro-6-deoxy-D-gulose 4-reductase [Halomicroarcula limicola]
MFAIAGGKGGCGKTTTALGLARGLATLGDRPLVADADLDMPDLHHRAGVDHAAGVAAVAGGERPTAVAASSPRFPDIDILPCRESDTATAASAFERLHRCNRPVLLDCPAGASPAAAAPLRAADRTVLVSTPDEQSLQDTAKTAAMARQLDAPPALLVLVRSAGRVDPSPLFDCRRVVHVPRLPSPPLRTDESAARYLNGAKILSKRNT